MTAQEYEQLIVNGIKGLPDESLAEIANFICFLRQRHLQPQALAEEVQALLIHTELRQLSAREQAHLEKEFEGYEQRFPRE